LQDDPEFIAAQEEDDVVEKDITVEFSTWIDSLPKSNENRSKIIKKNEKYGS